MKDVHCTTGYNNYSPLAYSSRLLKHQYVSFYKKIIEYVSMYVYANMHIPFYFIIQVINIALLFTVKHGFVATNFRPPHTSNDQFILTLNKHKNLFLILWFDDAPNAWKIYPITNAYTADYPENARVMRYFHFVKYIIFKMSAFGPPKGWIEQPIGRHCWFKARVNWVLD